MRIIEVPTAPPFGTIPVNTARIYAVRPHAAAPTKAADLLIESAGARSILAEVAFDTVASLLGPEFVEFRMADIARTPCRLNRTL
jgi:hypothetical protein